MKSAFRSLRLVNGQTKKKTWHVKHGMVQPNPTQKAPPYSPKTKIWLGSVSKLQAPWDPVMFYHNGSCSINCWGWSLIFGDISILRNGWRMDYFSTAALVFIKQPDLLCHRCVIKVGIQKKQTLDMIFNGSWEDSDISFQKNVPKRHLERLYVIVILSIRTSPTLWWQAMIMI